MKNSKLLIVLLSVLLVSLSGCSQKTNGFEVRKATKFCEDKEGVHHMDSFLGQSVKCNDGTFKMLSNIKAN